MGGDSCERVVLYARLDPFSVELVECLYLRAALIYGRSELMGC